MNEITRRLGICLVLMLLCTMALSEEKSDDKAATEEKGPVHAIVGGTVLPVSGPAIHRGTVLFQDGKIIAVGSEVAIPEGATLHSAEDRYVSPGLVAIESAVDGAKYMQGNFADSLDPYEREIEFTAATGLTTLHVLHTRFGGFMGHSRNRSTTGRATAIIKSTVNDLDGMLVKEPGANYLSIRKSMLASQETRRKFREAKKYLEKLAEAKAKKTKHPKRQRGLDAYVEALKGERSTVVNARDEASIRLLVELKQEFDFDLVISGADEGWTLAPTLAARGLSVILDARGPDFNFNFDQPLLEKGDMIPIRRPAAYAAAGVPVAIRPYRRFVSLDGIAGRDLTSLRFEAAFAVRGGMDEAAALEAITLTPAKILRIADRVGSLEKGKDADIVIWSGHPFHYRSLVETTWINGKIYYEHDKSTLFRQIPIER